MIQKINVLHLTDMAGGSSFQSHFYEKFGKGKSLVLIHKKSKRSDAVNFYQEGKEIKKMYKLILEAIKVNKEFDIIHVHQAEIIVPILKILTRKKIVLSYQGSDINHPGRSTHPIRIFCRSMADMILYNQKLHENKIKTIKEIPKYFIANGIDTEFFGGGRNKNRGKTALTIISSNLNKDKTLKEIKKIQEKIPIKDLEIIDTDKGMIQYRKIPKILSKFEFYFDIKITNYNFFVREFSNLGLQALSCGCKVIRDFGKGYEIVKGIPEEHTPEFVVNKLYTLYDKCLKK